MVLLDDILHRVGHHEPLGAHKGAEDGGGVAVRMVAHQGGDLVQRVVALIPDIRIVDTAHQEHLVLLQTLEVEHSGGGTALGVQLDQGRLVHLEVFHLVGVCLQEVVGGTFFQFFNGTLHSCIALTVLLHLLEGCDHDLTNPFLGEVLGILLGVALVIEDDIPVLIIEILGLSLVPLLGEGIIGLELISGGETELEEDEFPLTGSQAVQAGPDEGGQVIILSLILILIEGLGAVGEDLQFHLGLAVIIIDGIVNPHGLDGDQDGDIGDHLAHLLQSLQEFHLGDVPLMVHIELLGDLLRLPDNLGVAGGMDDVHLVEEGADVGLHPPDGIRGEAVTQGGIILADGSEDTMVGLLDEILQKDGITGVGLGGGDCEFRHPVEDFSLNPGVAGGDASEQGDFILPGHRLEGLDLLEIDIDTLGAVGVVHGAMLLSVLYIYR